VHYWNRFVISAQAALLWQHNGNPSYKLASIQRYDDIVRTLSGVCARCWPVSVVYWPAWEMHCKNLRLVLGLGLVRVSSRVRVRVKVRVSVLVRVSIRTNWVVNFAVPASNLHSSLYVDMRIIDLSLLLG